LIGDRAIHPPIGPFVANWDLGEEWQRWSRLPFVFAMWVARPHVDWTGVDVALSAARDLGLEHLAEIARAEASAVDLSPEECHSYLRDNLYFYLGPREQQGLELFRRYAVGLGLAPHECLDVSLSPAEVVRL
jgi:chorismate dehydratase